MRGGSERLYRELMSLPIADIPRWIFRAPLRRRWQASDVVARLAASSLAIRRYAARLLADYLVARIMEMRSVARIAKRGGLTLTSCSAFHAIEGYYGSLAFKLPCVESVGFLLARCRLKHPVTRLATISAMYSLYFRTRQHRKMLTLLRALTLWGLAATDFNTRFELGQALYGFVGPQLGESIRDADWPAELAAFLSYRVRGNRIGGAMAHPSYYMRWLRNAPFMETRVEGRVGAHVFREARATTDRLAFWVVTRPGRLYWLEAVTAMHVLMERQLPGEGEVRFRELAPVLDRLWPHVPASRRHLIVLATMYVIAEDVGASWIRLPIGLQVATEALEYFRSKGGAGPAAFVRELRWWEAMLRKLRRARESDVP